MEYNKKNPLRVVTLCSGYDSQCLALERLKTVYPEFDYELVAWSEFDPESTAPLQKQPAVIAHNALCPQWKDRNLGDMTKINWKGLSLQCDLLFYSTPCQSISSAGLQHGFVEGSGTRSSILWNVRDAVIALRPKFLCLENVKSIINKKFLPTFNLWQKELASLGYINFCKILNAKDYGTPQSRERLFLVSVRANGQESHFYFPSPIPLKSNIGELIEKNVSDVYRLPDEIVKRFKNNVTASKFFIGNNRYVLNTINGIACTLTCAHHYSGNIIHPRQGFREMGVIESDGTFRRLTARENFRIMGVEDFDIDKIQSSGLSITQQCKLAGNSIVIDVLYHLFRKMFIETENEQQLQLF